VIETSASRAKMPFDEKSCLLLEKFAEATRKFAALQSDLSRSVAETADVTGNGVRRRKLPMKGSVDKAVHKSMHGIKLAFSEFYLSLILLQNYQTLNFTGFRKILKKHDKVRPLPVLLLLCFSFMCTSA